jgi:hypothetical protein
MRSDSEAGSYLKWGVHWRAVDEAQDVAHANQIAAMPTFLLLKDGAQVRYRVTSPIRKRTPP